MVRKSKRSKRTTKLSRALKGRVSCGAASFKMSTKRGPRCVSICTTPGGWRIPRFRKSSSCARSTAKSWKVISHSR